MTGYILKKLIPEGQEADCEAVRSAVGAFSGSVGIALFIATGVEDYRINRILAFLNPELSPLDDAYQMRQSQIAIGSGGVGGIGRFVDGAMSQLNYVPADWTDFIYSTIGEAWGFLGCTLVLLMYLLIILRMLYLARFTYDKYGMLIIIGVIYFVLTFTMSKLVAVLEKKLKEGD